jgi:hypothetical protein
MYIQDVENTIYDNKIKLDIRVLNTNSAKLPNHIRLLDIYSKPVIDIYFKYTKRGKIIRNRYFIHKTQTWGQLQSEDDLIYLIRLT